jgi:hypothetical protein
VEVAHWALCIALVDWLCVLAAEAPAHEVTEHRGARLMKALGEVIDFLAGRLVQAGVHADAGLGIIGLAIGRQIHRDTFVSVLKGSS